MSINKIPSVNSHPRARWFVKRGASTNFDCGFRSKKEASDWIDSHENLDWREGFTFRIKGRDTFYSIVDRYGQTPKPL
jgi:hypothetical protein